MITVGTSEAWRKQRVTDWTCWQECWPLSSSKKEQLGRFFTISTHLKQYELDKLFNGSNCRSHGRVASHVPISVREYDTLGDFVSPFSLMDSLGIRMVRDGVRRV